MSSRPTLLLVHGAWHGAWCWERLLEPLARRGVAVATLDLPSVQRGGADSSAAPASLPNARSRAALMRRSGDEGQSSRPAGLTDDAAAVRALIEVEIPRGSEADPWRFIHPPPPAAPGSLP